MRPHQLTVSRAATADNSIKAVISFINPAGSSVKIDAKAETGNIIQVEITQEEYKTLKLLKNESVYLTPKNVTFCEYEI